MRLLHLTTSDSDSGAAIAALRLVEGLRARRHDARLLVRERTTAHAYVDAIGGDAATPRSDAALTQLADVLARRGRSSRSAADFSSDLPAYSIASLPALRSADAVHLHRVDGFVSALEIRRLQNLRKPVIWTLHDEWPFTGGCHYTGGCRGFRMSCHHCPQLVADARPLARLTLGQKRDVINPNRMVVVATSAWIAARARASALFRRARIEHVPSGIDVDARQRVTREAARRALGLPPGALVIFFACADHRETRKGEAHLATAMAALASARSHRAFQLDRLLLLTAGDSARSDFGAVRSHALGRLAPWDERLALAFRSADVVVLPSIEDNLPNTAIEALAAGVPVVGYRTGGIPEAIQDGVNGTLVARGDAKALARALGALLGDDALRQRCGNAATATARQRFDLPIQAAAYERIYAEEIARLSRGRTRGRRSAPKPRAVPPFADAPRLRALAKNRVVSQLFTRLLKDEVADLHRALAGRDAEIRGLRASAAWQRQVADREVATLHHAITTREREAQSLQKTLAKTEHGLGQITADLDERGDEIRHLRQTLEVSLDTERRRDRLRKLIGERQRTPRVARPVVGIFGAGDPGLRVVETVLELECNVGWLSDNNPQVRKHASIGCSVISPDQIPRSPFDMIVIGSAHRDAIRRQLLHLGVAPDRIVAPDVSQPDAGLTEELRRMLTTGPHHAGT